GDTYWPRGMKERAFKNWPLTDFADAYIGPSLISRFAEFAKDRLVSLLADAGSSKLPGADRALQELSRAIGWRGRTDEINEATTAIHRLADTDQRLLLT